MKKETMIQRYLKSSKANVSSNKNILFYLNHIFYYKGLLNSITPQIEKALLYGKVKVEINKDDIQDMYDFWLNAMIWYIETEKSKSEKNQKKKLKNERKQK